MASSKRPELRLSGNIAENFKNFELRFNDYCIQADYRDLTKDPDTQQLAYYKSPILEISALRSSMPDEALQVIRYTIEPQINAGDKQKPWVWMEKLRIHYTGSIGSSLMTDRFKFWHSQQNPHESVQDWEVRVRQAGNLCNYNAIADEMCRDKFVFGLNDAVIRTELLKTHLQTDNRTEKSMADVVSEAKTFEAAQKTNQLIIDSSKMLDEQVHHTIATKKHADMKLKREPNTCHWCGSNKGPHSWASCPAKGKTCSRCFGNDHFAKVCLEPLRRESQPRRMNNQSHFNNRNRNSNGNRGRGRGRGTFPQQNHLNYQLNQQHLPVQHQQQMDQIHSSEPAHRQFHDNHVTEHYTDDYDYIPAALFSLESSHEAHATSVDSGNKYFAHVLTSSSGNKFRPIKYQIDTAATCNTISANMIQSYFPDARLIKSPYLLYPYGDSNPIRPVGQVNLLCERKRKYFTLSFQVLPDRAMANKPPLLSGKDSQQLGLVNIYADEIHAVDPKPVEQTQAPTTTANFSTISPLSRPLLKEDILSTYSSSFSGIGCLQPPVTFRTKPDIPPIQMPIHRVPISKRQKEKDAIAKYVKEGILEKVIEPTPWCSNILCRESPSKFRVCIDPSQTINKTIERPVFQMPTLNEQLHQLANAKCFSLIDVKDGYLHIPLDEKSSYMTTMHTSYGRYRWTRLPFGISSAPEEFQSRLMTALEGLKGIALVADDILTYGVGDTYAEAEADHDQNILALMQRAREKDIRFNPSKFQFKQKELKFVGHIITEHGIKADPDKVSAIVNMEPPQNKAELLRFIGMVNFLSPFCANLSATIRPLTALTKDNMSFLWSISQQEAFRKAQDIIANTPVLQFYDLSKPITLQVDASDNGLGGVLMQPNIQGLLQPVAYTSCSLTETEKRYSQIEKECLAICNAFSKFDQWLYGKHSIEVHTDHKPLETIFKKPLNKAPARLQRMMMRLQRYHFTVTYRKGTSLYIADTLSRAASPQLSTNEHSTKFEVFRLEISAQYPTHHPSLTSATEDTLRKETHNDIYLSTLYSLILHGWPTDRSKLSPQLRQYWNYRDELSVNEGIIYKGHHILIPRSMQKEMLEKIHSNHLGAQSNIRMAREVLFWPGIWKDIKEMCDTCPDCAKYQNSAPREPMKSLPIPTLPWQIISQDLFDLNQKSYLVTVCHFSDWIEVDQLPNTLSNTIINCTKSHFSRFGIPEILHSDNGSQFISHEFAKFSSTYKFKHTRSSPYYPKGNGRAEAAVKVIKAIMKKSLDVSAALLTYRNTPQQGHSYSPVQRMMNRRTRTMLPTSNALLIPELVDISRVHQEITVKRQKAKDKYDQQTSRPHETIPIGSYAYAKPPPTKRGSPWTYGRIIDGDQNRSYTLQTPHGAIRRNRVHIRPAAAPNFVNWQPIARFNNPIPVSSTHIPKNQSQPPPPSPPVSTVLEDACIPTPTTLQATEDNSITCEGQSQFEGRPKRAHNLPSKYSDYVMNN